MKIMHQTWTLFKVVASLSSLALLTSVSGLNSLAAEESEKKKPTGYTNTPFIPGSKWRVHDDNRPRPKVVSPGRTSSTPPADAVILFDGTDLSKWRNAKGGSAKWIVENGYMQVPSEKERKGDIFTKEVFGDFQLHVEFATPAKVLSNSQGRGNSGVIIFGRYEVQVLDSYNNKTYADGQTSALYGWKPPLVNASRPSGEWQTYDIIFEAPKWNDDGKLVKKAYTTVLHNGVLTQHRQAFQGDTLHKKPAKYVRHAAQGPIKLQDHSNPMRFRNIWIRSLDLSIHDN